MRLLGALLVLFFISRASAQTCPAGQYYSCVSSTTFNLGYGFCPTYIPGHSAGNYHYCPFDGAACQECCECAPTPSIYVTCSSWRQGTCNNCPANTYSGSGATTCTACPAGTTSTAGSNVCVSSETTCNAGFTGPAGSCTACVAGKYKTTSGSASCTDCGAGTYSTSTGATLAVTCLTCPGNSNSPSPSSALAACTCNAGFTGPNGGVCSACVAGKYKINTGSAACIDCGAGTYSTSTGATLAVTCLTCPGNSNSPSPSSALAACTCNAGFTGPDGGSCTACAAGTYKSATGSAVCTNCLAGTYSATAGASSATVCTSCLAGTYSLAGASACITCSAGTYSLTGTSACTVCPINTFSGASASACQACQANATSVAGSVSQASCYCKTGYAHVVDSYTCRICDPGTYNSQLGRTACSNCSVGLYSASPGAVGNETCLACPIGQWSPEGSPSCNLCPANSQAPAASGSLSNCTCNAGYAGPNGGLCSVCAVGQYKTVTGSSVCTNCPGGTYSIAVAASSSTVCTDCVAGTYSIAVGASSSTVCTDCVAGTYSIAVGASSSTVCTNCVAGTYSTQAGANSSTVCTDCANGTYSSVAGGSVCTDCPAGTYSDVVGSSSSTVCTNCADGTYSIAVGASSSTVCTNCPAGTYSDVVGVSACTRCSAGTYSGASGSSSSTVCTNCAAGTYSIAVGASSSTVCTNCVAGTYSTQAGASACVNCSAGMYTAVAGASACANCTAGSYASIAGASACVSCPSDTFSGASASSCEPCQVNSVSVAGSASQEYCYCNRGHAHVAGEYTCKICDPGTYNSQLGRTACSNCSVGLYSANYGALGNETCLSCPLGEWSFEGSPSCNLCPVNSRAGASSGFLSDCICDSGYTGPNGVLCSACAAGQYKTVTGTSACENCVAGAYSNATGASSESVCVLCPAGTYSSVSGASACVSCIAGTYSAEVGASSSAVCINCPAGAYSAEVGASSVAVCVNCGTGTYSAEVGASSSAVCVNCGTGTYSAEVGASSVAVCTNCGTGTYSTTAGANSSTVCTNCVAGTYSSEYGATNASACVNCPEGMISLEGASACVCPANTYQNLDSLCTSCPLNSNSSVASVNITDCSCNAWCFGPNGGPCQPYLSTLQGVYQCNAGYTGPDSTGPCVACAVGTYKNVLGSVACSSCAPGQYQDALAATSCLSCAPDTFSNESGSSMCTTCPAGFKTLSGTTTIQDCCALNSAPFSANSTTGCACNVGYTGPDTGASKGQCSACLPGTYKASNGTANCTKCSVGTYSTAFAADSNATCEMCDAGQYAAEASASCTICPENSAAPAWSGLITNCLCNMGYTGPDGGLCVACSSGTYKDSNGSADCTNCSVGMYSPVVAADSETTCEMCPAGQYAAEASASCTICPENSAAPAWSGLITNCLCNTRFTGPDGGLCVNCAPGTYKATNGSATCTRCPLNSNSSAGSENITDCVCDAWCSGPAGGPCISNNSTFNATSGVYQCSPGFTGPDRTGPCLACALGKYKIEPGPAACTNCAPGKYQDALARTSCWSCAPDTFSNASGASVCATCPAGYKSLVGTVNSTDCCGLNSSPQNITCATGAVNVIASYSTTACARFISLTPKPSFASISTRLNAAVGTLPTYNPTGGPNGKGHVSFARASSQYLDAGSRTFNIATNGGFTVVAVVRFTGTVGSYERIIDFGSGTGNNNFLFARVASGSYIYVQVFNGGTGGLPVYSSTAVIVQNSWLTIVCTYRASTNEMVLSVNGISSAVAPTVAITDRTVSATYTGRSQWTGDAYLNGDIAGLFFVDEYLNTDATAAIVNTIVNGVDMTDTTCPAGNAQSCWSGIGCSCNTGYTGPDTGASKGQCSACPAGTYKSTNGSADCTACPLNSNSSTGSPSITDCVCDKWCSGPAGGPCISKNSTLNVSSGVYQCSPGFTGPDRTGPCLACALGKYKNVAGSVACSSCEPGQYQDALATTSCSSCAPDTFANASGAPLCTQCPAGYKSLVGTVNSTDCCALNSSPQNITCATGEVNVIASYSTTACARFIALTPKPSFASISTRNNAAVGSAILPTYNSLGGPNGKGHVSFDRTKSQYLDAGSRTFNFATNGGVTIVAVVRFTQNAGFYEMILDMGNSNNNNNILISRSGYTANLHVDFVNGGSLICGWDPIGVVVQNSWLTLVVSYRSSTNMCSVTANGVVSNRIASSPLTDRTVSKTWIGQGLNMQAWGGEYLNADLAGVFVVDEYLDSTTVNAISDTMKQGADLTSGSCEGIGTACSSGLGCSCNTGYTGPDTGPSKGQCSACLPGTYKATNGSANCTSCPLNSNSAVGSQNITDCICVVWCSGPNGGPCIPKNSTLNVTSSVYQCSPGYTGPDRTGPCVACSVGSYKNVPGPAECSLCAPGQYQDALATRSCLSCPPDTFQNASGTSVCAGCPAGFKALPGTTAVQDCCGLNSKPNIGCIAPISTLQRSCGSSGTDTCSAVQSSTENGWPASNALDQGGFSSSTLEQQNPWWRLDFGRPVLVTKVTVTNRADCCKERLANFKITVGDSSSVNVNAVCAENLPAPPNSVEVTCVTPLRGQYLHISLPYNQYLTIGEVQVTGTQGLYGSVCTACASGICSSEIVCSCNTGYTGPDSGASKGQCTICPSGTYKASNGSAACTSCAANSNSSAGSIIVTSCSCNPAYTGPNGGPCPACAAGKFKNASGTAACDVCATNTYSASGVSACTACAVGFTSPAGSTLSSDCCDPNTTFAKNVYDALSSTTKTALDPTSTYRPAYVVRVSSAPELKYYTSQPNPPAYISSGGYSGQAFLRFSKTSSSSGHNYLICPGTNWASFNGNTVVTVIRFMENIQGIFYGMQWGAPSNVFALYLSDTLQFCVWSYSTTCTDTAVPINVWLQVSYTNNPSAWPRQTLRVVYVSTTGTTVVLSKTNTEEGSTGVNDGQKVVMGYSPACGGNTIDRLIINNAACDRPNFDLAAFYLIQAPVSDADIAVLLKAIAIGTQILYDRGDTCQCNAGFGGTGRSNCASCSPGTYKSEVMSASCSLCAANTYSTAVQALNVSTCLACPNNSVSVAGRFECECNFGYEGNMYSCSACVPGKFKRFLGTSSCMECPANTEALGFATVVCSSLVGYNGLGYALDDVARSCGASLTGTCTTLSNGATSSGTAADGALDSSVSTFVSVAFNPNMARSCGNKGTDACVASHEPVFLGAASLANDGNTNTRSESDYQLGTVRPYWRVDFGQSRTVFAVKILSLTWQYLKDFKIAVGDSADAKSSANVVCADYLTGSGSSYMTYTCEDSLNGRYLYVINGPHASNYLSISEIVIETFNYSATPSLMLPWWAVDFEVERALSGMVIQTQASSVVQVRVGHSIDPLQNAVCAENRTLLTTANNNITCASAMLGRYLFVIGTGNTVLVLNDVRVLGAPTAQCAAGTYKPLVGNTNCTACPAFSSSVVGATSVGQCSCRAGYLDVWS